MSSFFLIPTITAPMPAAAAAIQAYTLASMLSPVCGALPLSADEDELVEVTPKNIRLRKKILNNKDRERMARRATAE